MSRVAKTILAQTTCLLFSGLILAGALYSIPSAVDASTAQSSTPARLASAAFN